MAKGQPEIFPLWSFLRIKETCVSLVCFNTISTTKPSNHQETVSSAGAAGLFKVSTVHRLVQRINLFYLNGRLGQN